jgi:hypothetical protein
LVSVLIVSIIYLGGSGFSILKNMQNGNVALLIQGITENELNKIILDYYRTEITNGATELSAQMIQTTLGDLNDDGKEDVIATLESGTTCGSGGCIASIFITDEFGELKAVPFSYAIKEIEILESVTKGMHDLRVNGDEANRMIWNDTTYELETI